MSIAKSEIFPVTGEGDVVRVRQEVRAWSSQIKMSLVDQTKLITAASELGRNMLNYGGGGTVHLELLNEGTREGVRLTFEDHGRGIPNIEQALKDGYTTGAGMGLGLGGSKRLVNEFEIFSEVGKGTRVMITRWK